ncbi:lactate utilization protein A [Arenibacter sp. NBRC 103722]|uniref:(Fe-S)-binding protein n=1 Tax=Arenibacter sp. NBRC 103722 TaxID=1113929 RepID=UPI00085390D8|nr:(Fe-S)-binding protein [Arenibacter sp. NBRC 103722]GBF21815.1 lactate utilization protein A [Arenibacter sp. NBRC 103722]
MKVGLFIPCYIDQFYPQVGVATLELLERLGLKIYYPKNQTCCGQPMANSGFECYSKDTYNLFVKNFQDYDFIVSPSGSCAYHVRNHFNIIEQDERVVHIRKNTFELCDFITNVLGNTDIGASFHKKVGLHQSCHGLRGLRLGDCSELVSETNSIAQSLLLKVKGLQLMSLKRQDECCGFGGTFAITEEAISIKMGKDRLTDHIENGVEIITATDMSCLMHLEGISKRNNLPIEVKHIAEILNSQC